MVDNQKTVLHLYCIWPTETEKIEQQIERLIDTDMEVMLLPRDWLVRLRCWMFKRRVVEDNHYEEAMKRMKMYSISMSVNTILMIEKISKTFLDEIKQLRQVVKRESVSDIKIGDLVPTGELAPGP